MSTAHYGDNLVRFLISKDFKVCVLNLIQTSFMRKNNVHKTKTDKVDTFVIAKTLMMQASLRFLTLEDLDYLEFKELGRSRQKLVKPLLIFNIKWIISVCKSDFLHCELTLKINMCYTF